MDVPIRDAATVVLLRDGPDGLEVWLQRRASTMVFAADMHAFPGGAVDPEDWQVQLPGVDVASHVTIWGDSSPATAAALVAAAVRETREEAAVLLDPAGLVPWGRWQTPPGETRRFDARFFVAACPPEAVPRAAAGEVAQAFWVVVATAVEQFAAGDLPMWPPTIGTLIELRAFPDVRGVLDGAPRHITKVTE